VNPGIVFVILQNEFDDDRLDDGMEVGSAGCIDQIAFCCEDRHHRIA
jgi:hypothetical protein